MQRLGFIHDMLDVKVLILYVVSHAAYPVTLQEIYELSFQDECLSYFDVCTAVPEMVRSGHLREIGSGRYLITEKGREQGEVTEDSIAYTVRLRAKAAVEEFNQRSRQSSVIETQINRAQSGELSVFMSLANETGNLMRLELAVPNQTHAEKLSELMKEKGENLYQLIIGELITEESSQN